MFTFRKALIVAAFILTFFFFLHSSAPSSVTTTPFERHGDIPSKAQATSGQQQLQHDSTMTMTTSTASMLIAPTQSVSSIDKSYPTKPKQQLPQLTLAELRTKPLREQLRYQFPYDAYAKFPAYIWQTWKYTPADGGFADRFRPAEASWTELHPGFVHEVITDSVAVNLIKYLYAAIPDVVEAYIALPVAVLKADFFRYLILLARGGIYSDIDTFALKPATDWLPEGLPLSTVGLVIGIEADPDRPDWNDWYSRRIQFCQWTIQSKPGHPVLRDIVATITEDTLRMKREHHLEAGKLDKSIVEFTGPAVWTDTVFRYLNNPDFFDMSKSKNITWEAFTNMEDRKHVGDVVVLPITSFSPGVNQMGARDTDHPLAFVKHDFEGSWKPGNQDM